MLINKTFNRFLLPSIIMVFAVSISEFVDAIIVAQLLGSKAMAVVHVGSPIMFLMAMLATLLGVGGSTLYAKQVGKHQKEEAQRTYTISFWAGVVIVTIITLLLLFLFTPTMYTICKEDSELIVLGSEYFKILILSIPVITIVMLTLIFLPSEGMPRMATTLTIIANVVNLFLDVVFIKFFGMGIEGAAWATLCGYLIAGLIYCLLKWCGVIHLNFIRVSWKDIYRLKKICSMGSSSALSQLSFAIKLMFCNALAVKFGGTEGIIIFSVCFQMLSIASIFVGGIGSAIIRIVAFLRGQKDFSSISTVTKRAYWLQLICSGACTLLFFVFSKEMAQIYDVKETQILQQAIPAIRIFSLCLLLRGVCIMFMFYVQAIGRSIYASAISIIDGFVGIIPISLILCLLMGIDGLWWSFPVSAVLLACGILLYNKYLLNKYSDDFADITLVEKDKEAISIYNGTWRLDTDNLPIVFSSFVATIKSLPFDPSPYITNYLQAILSDKKKLVDVDYIFRECNESIIIELRSDTHKLYPSINILPQGVTESNNITLGINSWRLSLPKIVKSSNESTSF